MCLSKGGTRLMWPDIYHLPLCSSGTTYFYAFSPRLRLRKRQWVSGVYRFMPASMTRVSPVDVNMVVFWYGFQSSFPFQTRAGSYKLNICIWLMAVIFTRWHGLQSHKGRVMFRGVEQRIPHYEANVGRLEHVNNDPIDTIRTQTNRIHCCHNLHSSRHSQNIVWKRRIQESASSHLE